MADKFNVMSPEEIKAQISGGVVSPVAAGALRQYLDTTELPESQPVEIPGIGEMTPSVENLNKITDLYQKMAQVSPEEQEIQARLKEGLALDPIRDFVNPRLRHMYGKGLKMPTQPGVEAEPTTKQKLIRGLKNTAFNLPAMVGLPVFSSLVETESKARKQAADQYSLVRQDLAQLLSEQSRMQQDRRNQFTQQLALMNPLINASLKRAELQRRIEKDKEASRQNYFNIVNKMGDDERRMNLDVLQQNMRQREFALAQTKDARAQEKYEGELNTTLNLIGDSDAAKALNKPVEQLTPAERAPYRSAAHAKYQLSVQKQRAATGDRIFTPKSGMYLVQDPEDKLGVKLVPADSVLKMDKEGNTTGRIVIGPTGERMFNARYLGSEGSEEVKKFNTFKSSTAVGDRYISSLGKYLFDPKSGFKLVGGIWGRVRDPFAQFADKYPGGAALSEIYGTNMGLQHVQAMYRGRPNIYVVEKVMNALGSQVDARSAAIAKGISNKLILELWMHDLYVNGGDESKFDPTLPSKMVSAIETYTNDWKNWKPGMPEPQVPSIKNIANGTYKTTPQYTKEQADFIDQRLGRK